MDEVFAPYGLRGGNAGYGPAKTNSGELKDLGLSGDPGDWSIAPSVMDQRISKAWGVCNSRCTSNDDFMIASGAQNGGSFTKGDVQELMGGKTYGSCRTSICYSGTNLPWQNYYSTDAKNNNYSKGELTVFAYYVAVLQSRGWPVPADLNWYTIDDIVRGISP